MTTPQYSLNVGGTGYGSYFGLSMMDKLWHSNLTQDEAVALMEKAIAEVGVLTSRDLATFLGHWFFTLSACTGQAPFCCSATNFPDQDCGQGRSAGSQESLEWLTTPVIVLWWWVIRYERFSHYLCLTPA